MVFAYLCMLFFTLFCGLFQESIHGKCLHDQRSYLLQFSDGLVFPSSSLIKNWNLQTEDCCMWYGVECDSDGHAVGLDLQAESLSPRNDNWKTLFCLQYLEVLNLAGNHFNNSPIPMELYNLTRLQYLNLASSAFSGQIPYGLSKLNRLVTLKLSNSRGVSVQHRCLIHNRCRRSMSRWQVTNPEGKLEVTNPGGLNSLFQNLTELNEIYLDTVIVSAGGSDWLNAFSHMSKLKLLSLSDCQLSGPTFPSLSNLSSLATLDLSLNSFNGEIPNWIWKLNLDSLNLSFNLLSGVQKPHTQPDFMIKLDLHSNALKGEISNLPTHAIYVDYSNNNLTFSIPPNIDYQLNPDLQFLSLSNNSVSGGIPGSLCNLQFLEVLDLSNNFLNGTVPRCLFEGVRFGVLKLSGNELSGHIPDAFGDDCDLRTLDLSQNAFSGKMPLSLVKCKLLQVVNVGDNYLEDHFPCQLMEGQNLSVLVLQSNKFHGEISCQWNEKGWKYLQILDVSINNFSGTLPPQILSNCTRMMVADKSESSSLEEFHGYYKDSVTLVIKGNAFKLENILSIYKTMDFSGNNFQGKIPKEIGGLKGLFTLNLSYNAFTDTIPVSVGNKVELQSLDLSWNQLTGRIPSELANLTFLSVLNLSYNQLTGNIPDGYQLQTFSESSFLGNKGLCGFPLESCDHGSKTNGSLPPAAAALGKKEIDWEYVCLAMGFSVGIGFVMLLNFLNTDWWQRFTALIIRFLILTLFGVQVQERQYRNPIPRL